MVYRQVLYNSNDLKIIHYENVIEHSNECIEIQYSHLCHEPKRNKLFILDLESRFFYSLAIYVKNYNQFRNSFYKFISILFQITKEFNRNKGSEKSDIFFSIDFKFLSSFIIQLKHDIFNLNLENQKIDLIVVNLKSKDSIIRQWSSLVNSWINKKLKYDNFNAFLSTLGGAYSSLGEESLNHAINAQNISKKQLILALEFNDPNAICRSKLFLAFSYIQLLNFKEAYMLLKDVKNYVECEETKKLINDDKLRIMCKAGLKKLKFTVFHFREKKAYFSDRGRLRPKVL